VSDVKQNPKVNSL